MSTKTRKALYEKENLAINLAKIVYQEKLTQISNNEIIRASTNDASNIPIILPVSNNFIKEITKIKRGDKSTKLLLIKSVISDNYLLNIIDTYTNIQITCPTTENSYKKHILDLVNAAKSNKPFCIDINGNDKKRNCYNIYIDNKENRICFVIWNGQNV